MREKAPREEQSQLLLSLTPKHNHHFGVLRDRILVVLRCRRALLVYCLSNRLWCARTQRASKNLRQPPRPNPTRGRRMGSVGSPRLPCARPLLPQHRQYALATDRTAWTYPALDHKAVGGLEAYHTALQDPLIFLHRQSLSSQGTTHLSVECHQQSRR
jgi:hypothetical protein